MGRDYADRHDPNAEYTTSGVARQWPDVAETAAVPDRGNARGDNRP